MRLVCNVSVGNRALATLNVHSKRKHIKSTLALCKKPKSEDFCIIYFSAQNKSGTKYEIKDNITNVLTKFVNEGKATIQFKKPAHDFYIQSDTIQLKGFLHLLKRAIERKISDKELTYSSMSVTAVSTKNMAPTKLCIQKRSDYPLKGFPRTLEVLEINNIQRCSLDRGILNLIKLKSLDLSNNSIECLPEEFSNLPNLTKLDLSNNNFGKSSPRQWSWLSGNVANTLQYFAITSNHLKFLPDQIIKLHSLVTLNVDHNEIKTFPSGIGNLRNLRALSASNNLISSVPGSAKKWRLDILDLSNNRFDPTYQSSPASKLPKPLPVLSLKEYAAIKVLQERLPFTPLTLPRTVIQFLNVAKYCVCGRACFGVYFIQTHMLLLSSVTQKLCTSYEDLAYVPMVCYFCSIKCFGKANYKRNSNPVI